MVEERGLTEEVADKVGNYVKLRGGGFELLEELCADQVLTAVKDAKTGLDEMRVLLGYCKLFGVMDKVGFLYCTMTSLN